jgi:energy-coupling factor transport system permease protein
MLRDITLGQYYPVDSPLHRLDPRTKILMTIGFVVAVFLVTQVWGYLACWHFWPMVHISRIPVKLMLRSLRPLRILLIFTFVLNLFFGSGGTELLRLGFVVIRSEGLNNAVHFSMRLVFLVVGSSLLTLTTAPVTLTDGMEKLASPLKAHRLSGA